MRRVQLVAAVVLAGAVAGACGSSGDTGTNNNPSGPTVNASPADVFNPSTLTVAVGATVTWVFGSVEHNVTFNSSTPGVPTNIGNSHNKNVARTFSTAGTFAYQCTLHAGMTGSITVQ